MDYKKLIRSRALRIKIMQFLSFIPDKTMVQLQYCIKTGHRLNLNDPKRFTEKLQAYKLYYRDPLMKQCVDKYDVREYVRQCGLGHILNDCYGVYNHPDEIDFDALPQAFVLKDTLGGGGNSVIVVKDKTDLNVPELREKLLQWVNEPTDKKHPGREWVYDGRKHRIVIEKYLEQPDGDLPDYKFFCFNGKVETFYVRTNYAATHEGELAFFDNSLQHIAATGMNYCRIAKEKPSFEVQYVEKMMEYAQQLSNRFPHVRVDFYFINNALYFGELTFFNASGYMTFEPDEFDFEMGRKFVLPKN